MNELVIIIFLIVSIISLLYASFYNSFQKYITKINEVENTIDNALRERYDLLNKAASYLKEQINEDVLKELDDIKTNELSNFELDRKLVLITKEFYELKIAHRNLIKNEDFTNIDFSLKENEAQIDGYILYYNDNISKYNHLVRIFPSNIVAKISNFQEKTFYDGKDMSDNNFNDFKL